MEKERKKNWEESEGRNVVVRRKRRRREDGNKTKKKMKTKRRKGWRKNGERPIGRVSWEKEEGWDRGEKRKGRGWSGATRRDWERGLKVGKPWRISAQLHPTVTAAAVSRPRTFVRRGFRVRWRIVSARECREREREREREDHRRLSFIDQLILPAVLWPAIVNNRRWSTSGPSTTPSLRGPLRNGESSDDHFYPPLFIFSAPLFASALGW